MKQNKLYVKDLTVSLVKINEQDFISLTDIARSKNTIELINFKGVEFDPFKNETDILNVPLFGMNAELIRNEIPQIQRLEILNNMAINQLNSISKSKSIQSLKRN